MTDAGVLRVEGLCKSFDGLRALKDVTLAFSAAEVTAVVGPNGAGKTTLLNVVTGFLKPDSGHTFWRERDMSRLPPYRVARLGIARTFQELRLIEQVPVLENVMIARPRQRGERLWRALTGVGLAKEEEANLAEADRLLRFVGLEGKARELAGELSYGQQKLLTLAMLLATEASVLLLDEPVAGVHPEMSERILRLLVELKGQGKGVIFIEHDLQAVRKIADRVIVLDEGRVIANGPPAEVLARPAIMEAYIA